MPFSLFKKLGFPFIILDKIPSFMLKSQVISFILFTLFNQFFA